MMINCSNFQIIPHKILKIQSTYPLKLLNILHLNRWSFIQIVHQKNSQDSKFQSSKLKHALSNYFQLIYRKILKFFESNNFSAPNFRIKTHVSIIIVDEIKLKETSALDSNSDSLRIARIQQVLVHAFLLWLYLETFRDVCQTFVAIKAVR